MSKVMQGLLFVGLVMFTVSAQAGVNIEITYSVNSQGDDVYVLTAISDGAPITSLGIRIWSDTGSLGQVHPSGFDTMLMDYNPFFGATPVNHDTQALFATAADNLLVVAGGVDSADELNVNFTGFAPFTSRAIAQIVVLDGGHCDCEIGTVAGGVEETYVCIPEPASIALLAVASMTMIHRRRTA